MNMLKVAHDKLKSLTGGGGEDVDLSEYAKRSELTSYAKKSDLDPYAKKTDLNVLSTVPSTQEGKIWFAFENHQPILKIYYGGKEYAFASTDALPEGAQVYYINRGDAIAITYTSDDVVALGAGLELADAQFITRNEYKDLALTFADGTTATLQPTIASALENLNNGRQVTFVDADERRHLVSFYADGRIVEGSAITLTSDYADSASLCGQLFWQ